MGVLQKWLGEGGGLCVCARVRWFVLDVDKGKGAVSMYLCMWVWEESCVCFCEWVGWVRMRRVDWFACVYVNSV